jgi:predicted secreted hydrolase
MKRRPPVAVLLGLLLAACSGPILANPPLVPIAPPTATPGPSRAPDPIPISLPRDDAPHDRLTEWWYYTGHLRDDAGGRWGFEFVIFRAERGGFPVAWASHLAITDEVGGTFAYEERSDVGPQVDRSGLDGRTFALVMRDPDQPVFTEPTAVPSIETGTVLPTTWVMAGESTSADLVAAMDDGRYGIELRAATAPDLPPVLHDLDGWIDFGPAGGSYYYSRTRLDVAGTLAAGGVAHPVTGTAWFDHQWGDFISVGGGGWDWFAVNLDDGTDLTISLVRAADGSYPVVYGTLVDADGGTTNLARTAFEVRADPSRTWTSPATGATYPAGWTIEVPGEGLVIDLEPTVAAQELDTRPTTGVVYWEGSQVVAATRYGTPVRGEAYVELTGYAPAVP